MDYDRVFRVERNIRENERMLKSGRYCHLSDLRPELDLMYAHWRTDI